MLELPMDTMRLDTTDSADYIVEKKDIILDPVKDLPEELSIKIFSYLNYIETSNCRSVCTKWKYFLDNQKHNKDVHRLYSDCHPLADTPSLHEAFNQYKSSTDKWLYFFSNKGKEESLRLKSLIKDKFFHHELFSSISKVLVQENILTCKKISDITEPSIQRLNDARFSPNGNYVVTAYNSGKRAVVWQLNKGEWKNIYEIQHTRAVVTARFSPDSKNLVTTSLDKTAKISTCVNGIWESVAEIKHEAYVRDAYFSPDGNTIITITTGTESKILIFKDEKWEELQSISITIEGEDLSIKDARFSPDGNYLIIAYDHVVAMIFKRNNKGIWSVNYVNRLSNTLISVAFSHDGSHFITTCEDKTSNIFVLTDGMWREEDCITHDSIVTNAIFSPDGKYIVTVFGDYGAKIWRVLNGKWQEKAFISHDSKVYEAEFSPDGNHLLTCSDDKTAKIWGIIDDKWQEKATMMHEYSVIEARFNPTGTQVITITSKAGPAYIWVLKSKPKQELHE